MVPKNCLYQPKLGSLPKDRPPKSETRLIHSLNVCSITMEYSLLGLSSNKSHYISAKPDTANNLQGDFFHSLNHMIYYILGNSLG